MNDSCEVSQFAPTQVVEPFIGLSPPNLSPEAPSGHDGCHVPEGPGESRTDSPQAVVCDARLLDAVADDPPATVAVTLGEAGLRHDPPQVEGVRGLRRRVGAVLRPGLAAAVALPPPRPPLAPDVLVERAGLDHDGLDHAPDRDGGVLRDGLLDLDGRRLRRGDRRPVGEGVGLLRVGDDGLDDLRDRRGDELQLLRRRLLLRPAGLHRVGADLDGALAVGVAGLDEVRVRLGGVHVNVLLLSDPFRVLGGGEPIRTRP